MINLKKVLLFFAVVVLCFFALASAEEQQNTANDEIVLNVGSRGELVLTLQKLLSVSGFYYGEIDGIYGQATQEAIMEVQRSLGGDVDGVVTAPLMKYLRSNTPDVSRGKRAVTMIATAYSAYDPGCGSYTASGNLLRKGLVAVDPGVIPLGTKLFIPGYGYAIADDTGGAIYGNKIDLAFDSYEEAIAFGCRTVTVYIIG